MHTTQAIVQASPCLSSSDLAKAWRWDTASDFHALSDDERPIETSILHWSSYNRFLPFPHDRQPLQDQLHHAFSSDVTKLAVAVGSEVDVYDLETKKRTTLCGHTVQIECLAFRPGRSDTLVSSAIAWMDETNTERAEVFIWDLTEAFHGETSQTGQTRAEGLTRDLVERIRTGLSEGEPPISLPMEDQEDLTTTLNRLLGRILVSSAAQRIHGRLCSSNQSSMFNHAGNVLVIQPGNTPQANGDDQWDIDLYNLDTHKTVTLEGHRDVVTWIGFSANDKLAVSASFDGTYRAWETGSGTCLHVWTTECQNVTGVISPDNEQFSGIDGDSVVSAWSLKTGHLIWSYKADHSPACTLDWSGDGRYVLAGCLSLGRILLFDTNLPIVDTVLEPVQKRVLSLEKTDLDPQVKGLAAGFLEVRSLRFIPQSDDEIMFGSATDLDGAVEIVSLNRGKRWRILPISIGPSTDAPHSNERSVDTPVWSVLPRSAQIAVVGYGGAWFWNLR
jgi:WD40 repeat protein